MKKDLIAKAAAVVCAAVLTVSAAALKKADTDPLTAPFYPVPELAAAANAFSKDHNDRVKSDTDSVDTEIKDNDSVGESGKDAHSPALPRLPEESGNSTSDSGGSGKYYDGDPSGGGRADNDGSKQDENIPGETPQDGDESAEQLFTTSIKNGEHVKEPEYSFTITHLNKSYKLKSLAVRLNGRKTAGVGSVTLSEDGDGKNIIRIEASYSDKQNRLHSGFREYTVWLDGESAEKEKDSGKAEDEQTKKDEDDASRSPAADGGQSDSQETLQQPVLYTDLESGTTTSEQITFRAYIEGGENASLKVYLGGQRLFPDGDNYSCTLGMGLNTVRFKASAESDGKIIDLSRNIEIRRAAETTSETRPRLSYHNVPEQVRGEVYTLDLIAEDFEGNRIYQDGITVMLNGREIKCGWLGEYTSYLLDLTGGENVLDIRITDSLGRIADYSFTVICTALQNGDVIGRCSISLDAEVLSLGTLFSDGFDILWGETALDAITRTLSDNGYTAQLRENYIYRISKEKMAEGAEIPEALMQELMNDSGVRMTENYSPDSLGEKDLTSLSGWMIEVNGHYISYGAQDLHLKDGDTVRIRFTLAAGKDIGDKNAGGAYENIY